MIPKKIHVSWNDKNILQSKHPLIVNGLSRLVEMNPEWSLEISDDNDVDSYLSKCLRPEDYEMMKVVSIVPKIDIWRLFKIFNEGGLYIDIDRLCNVKLDDLASDDIDYVLPTCRDYDFSHDIMMSRPGNPIFMLTADMSLQRRREGSDHVYFLGAQTYMHSITQVLFKQMINTNPGLETFEQMRNIISKEYPTIKMYREDPPMNTMVYKNDGSILNHETLKRDFYAQSGLKHWTGEW